MKSKNSSSKKASNWFEWLLLTPAFVPFLYIGGLIYPFLTPKTFLIRLSGILAAALFAYLVSKGEPFFWSRLRKPFTWIPALLLVWTYVTSLLGVGFYHSFWSTFERGDGLLSLSVVIILYYLVILSARETFFLKLSKALSISAGIAAIYALLQWFQGLVGISLPLIASANGRVGGTFGNAAFMASYLGITTVFTFVYALTLEEKKKRNFHLGSVVLQVLAIIVSSTRGSMLALLGAALLATLYLSWKGAGKTRTLSRVVLAALLVFAGVFFLFRDTLKNSSISPVARLASISFTEGTVSSRLFLWKNLFAEGLKKPITGYGAEQVSGLFDKIYDPTLIVEQWFDRSHNAFLDYFLQYGVIGLLLYVGLIVRLVWNGWRLLKKGKTMGGALALGALVYAVQNFFVFDTAMTLWLFFALLAFSEMLLDETPSSVLSEEAWLRYAGIVKSGVLILSTIPLVFLPLYANILLAEAYHSQITDVDSSIQTMKGGYQLHTFADLEYGYEIYLMYTSNQLTMLHGTDLVKAHDFAEQVLARSYAAYPYDARTALYYAHVLDAVPAGEPRNDALLAEVVEKAISLSPKRTQSWYIKANIYLHGGDVAQSFAEKVRLYKEGIAVVTDYTKSMPTYSDPRFIIAGLYETIGDKANAQKWADEGSALYTNPNGETARRAARYYIAAQDWVNAARFLKDVASAYPDDLDNKFDYAKALLLSGDKARAIDVVNEIRKQKPGFVEQDPNFLHALGLQ